MQISFVAISKNFALTRIKVLVVVSSLLFTFTGRSQDSPKPFASSSLPTFSLPLRVPASPVFRTDSGAASTVTRRFFAAPQASLRLRSFSYESEVWNYQFNQHQQQKLTNIRYMNTYNGYKEPEEGNKVVDAILKNALSRKKRTIKAPRLD